MSQTDYDTDFYAWTQAQAAALRAKDWQAFDLANLAEEIESLGKRDRRTLESSLKILLLHLLKWTYQSQERRRRGRSWRSSIANARDAIEHVLRDSPSLRRALPEALTWAYPRARRQAHDQTGLALSTFPDACPWTLEQLEDLDFMPEGVEDDTR